MDWLFYGYADNCHLAYKLENNLVYITSCIYHHHEPSPDESDAEIIELRNNGEFVFRSEHYNELTQFNCCHDILTIIQIIHLVQSKQSSPIDFSSYLTKPDVFKVENIRYKESYYDVCFDIILDNQKFAVSKQFSKYTFIDGSLLNKVWTIEKLASFSVQMMKVLFNLENEVNYPYKMYLQTDRFVEDFMSKKTGS